MKEGISKLCINILIFIGLCFLGITGRISYDVEIKKIKYRFWSYFNRLFIGTIICYIIQLFLFKIQLLKEFYSAIILTLSFFSIDIISFFTNNFNIIIVYILNMFLKSFKDTVEGISKANKNNKKQ